MMTIDLATVAIHAVFFFTAMFFFTRFVLTPLVSIRDARCAATAGKETSAAQWITEATQLEKTYANRLLQAKIDVQTLRDSVRSAASAKASDLLAAARQRAAQRLDQAKAEIAVQMDSARQTLTANSEEFSGLIASRMLDRDVRLVDEAVVNEARRVASIGKAH